MATAAGIRAAVAGLLVGVVTKPSDAPLAPHCNDWRALSLPFRAEGLRLGRIRPRSLAEYAASAPRDPPAHLPRACPAGLFATHLLDCAACTKAECERRIDADCMIHTACALMEGLWPVWGPDGPPPLPTEPLLPYSTVEHGIPPDDIDFAADALQDQVDKGCGEWVTPTRDNCAMIAPVWVAHQRRPNVPSSASAAIGPPDAALDAKAIAAIAAKHGATDAESYISHAEGADPSTHEGRSLLATAWRSAHQEGYTYKRRLVERLDTTVNDHLTHMGVRFARATDVLTGARPDDDLMADDGTMAYRAVPVSPDLARYLCTQCPRTKRVFRPLRLPFGYSQACASYSIVTAIIKAGLNSAGEAIGGVSGEALSHIAEASPLLARVLAAISPPLANATRAGLVTSTGIVDDIFGRHPRALRDDVDRARGEIFSVCGYTRAPAKHRVGPSATVLGLRASVAGPNGGPSISVEGPKLYATLRDVAMWARIGDLGGAVPLDDHESLVGDLGWLAQVDYGTALRMHGIRASLLRAQAARHRFVAVGQGSPCRPPLCAILDRFKSGAATATPVVSAASYLATLRVSARSSSAGLQARGAMAGAAAFASDAALDPSGVTWALVELKADGSHTATRGHRPAVKGESSMSAELEAVSALADTFPERKGTTVVLLMDSLCAVLALLKAKARFGTRAFLALDKILGAAETHGVELLPIWVPRTLNTLADSLTHPSPSA